MMHPVVPLLSPPVCALCAAAFENLVPISAARELGKALPGTLSPVVDAVGKAVGDLPAVLKINPGKQNSDKLSELQAVSLCK